MLAFQDSTATAMRGACNGKPDNVCPRREIPWGTDRFHTLRGSGGGKRPAWFRGEEHQKLLKELMSELNFCQEKKGFPRRGHILS